MILIIVTILIIIGFLSPDGIRNAVFANLQKAAACFAVGINVRKHSMLVVVFNIMYVLVCHSNNLDFARIPSIHISRPTRFDLWLLRVSYKTV